MQFNDVEKIIKNRVKKLSLQKNNNMSDIKTVLESAKSQMEKTIAHLEVELAKIRAGKANPQMLDRKSVV